MPRFKESELRVSQHQVIEYGAVNNNFACFSNMGFGKTAAIITLVEKLFRLKEVRRLLVVTTLRVARDTWPEELQDWEQSSYLKFKVISGDEGARLAAARGKEQIHIINQENFVWLAERAGRTWPYDMVVFDDVEGFKNANRKTVPSKAICQHESACGLYEHENSRVCTWADFCIAYRPGAYAPGCIMPCQDFKPVRPASRACTTLCRLFASPPARYTRFGALCALGPQIKRLVHLTGTPSNRGLLDLWPLIFTLDGGDRLGRTYSQYKNRFFNKSHNGFTWELKPGGAAEIHEKIKDICISITSEAEAELPACQHINQVIELPGEAAKLYDTFERDLFLNIDGEEITAANSGVLAGKLLQVCGGAVYTGTGRDWVELHDQKFKALDSILLKHKYEPVLVGYNFEHELTRLKARYPFGVNLADRRDAVHAWNAGEIPLLFTHPKSAGHGLNLQRGPGRVLVWFGLSWRLDHNKQLNKRLWRPGQAREVFIYYLIAKGRADVRLMQGVAKYDWTQDQLLEAVKRDARLKNA
jgi:hypothetical protein